MTKAAEGARATGPFGVVLVAHGTVESLDELPAFLTTIRRGHAAPPALAAEVRRRYEAIGGQSPLNAHNRALASKVEAILGVPVRTANRLASPSPKDVLAGLAGLGVRRVAAVPLAQHSAHVYAESVRAAAADVPEIGEVVASPNWGRAPGLTEAFAKRIAKALAEVPKKDADRAALVLSAHSLPTSAAAAGDPYESEFRASVEDVVAAVRGLTATGEKPPFAEHDVCFQSAGAGGGEWLGPDLRATLEAVAARGRTHVVVAPIGFLADHVEILYDLDIEAKGWCDALGLTLHRSASLNSDDDIVSVVAGVAKGLMGG